MDDKDRAPAGVVTRPRGSGARFVPPHQVTWRRHGRREPYTTGGIRRLPCFRCGQAAEHQWSACSDDNLWRPVCLACDVALNRLVLEWMGFSSEEVEAAIAAYTERGMVAGRPPL